MPWPRALLFLHFLHSFSFNFFEITSHIFPFGKQYFITSKPNMSPVKPQSTVEWPKIKTWNSCKAIPFYTATLAFSTKKVFLRDGFSSLAIYYTYCSMPVTPYSLSSCLCLIKFTTLKQPIRSREPQEALTIRAPFFLGTNDIFQSIHEWNSLAIYFLCNISFLHEQQMVFNERAKFFHSNIISHVTSSNQTSLKLICKQNLRV